MAKNLKEERLGATNYNNQGYLMKVVEYNSNNNIVVEFQDCEKTRVKTRWTEFCNGSITNPYTFKDRLGTELVSNQGCLMKCVEYINADNIIIEFQDKYKYRVNTTWRHFVRKGIKNIYAPTVLGVGILGNQHELKGRLKDSKEYQSWKDMLGRCYNENAKQKYPTYKDVTCCKEWLLFDNFVKWLHSQENFEVWKSMPLSALDKDILVKGNKVYGPDTCCLVPYHVNMLFETSKKTRGNLPIGVRFNKDKNKYAAQCSVKIEGNKNRKTVTLGVYDTEIDAFNAYKYQKEFEIQQVAQEEYKKGTISKKCYEAMMRWEVEITD